MKLIKIEFEGLELFDGATLELDMYATDRVMAETTFSARKIPGNSTIATQTTLALTGLNATGKTTVLRAIALAGDIVGGYALSRRPALYAPLCETASPRGITFRAIIEHDDTWYLLESELDNSATTDAANGDPFDDPCLLSFTHEKLWVRQRQSRTLRKKTLTSFDAFKKECTLSMTRGVGGRYEIPPEEGRFLPPDVSVIKGLGLKTQPARTYFDSYQPRYTIPNTDASIIRLFDPSVDLLTVDDEGHVHLRFTNDDSERIVSQRDAALMLSMGTVRGARMLAVALGVLEEGGMLLVDEIENSLNKKLVETIINLFRFPRTNPKGACLVFTTHYPELLDAMERIDGIYITTRTGANGAVQVRKYSDLEDRPDISRADAVLSNRFRGTAPHAADIRSLYHYVERRAKGETDK